MKTYIPNLKSFINNLLPQSKPPRLEAGRIHKINLLKYLCSLKSN